MSLALLEPVSLGLAEEGPRSRLFDPRVIDRSAPRPAEVDWAIAAVVVGIIAIAIAVIAYICTVCNARSVQACVNAVRRYFSGGC